MITVAISEVHFTIMRRAGLCRDLCEWKAAQTASSRPGHGGGANQGFTKGRLLPLSRSVSHQSQSCHQAMVNAVLEGMRNPPRQGLRGELLLNHEL